MNTDGAAAFALTSVLILNLVWRGTISREAALALVAEAEKLLGEVGIEPGSSGLGPLREKVRRSFPDRPDAGTPPATDRR